MAEDAFVMGVSLTRLESHRRSRLESGNGTSRSYIRFRQKFIVEVAPPGTMGYYSMSDGMY